MKNKYRVVIDTNIVISALLKKRSIPRKAVDFVLSHHIFLASSETLMEARQKIFLPKFDAYVSASDRRDFLKQFFSFTTFINTTSNIRDCRDPKDNKFLELAVDGNADCIVSGDKDLLVLNPFREIPILSPREFLDMQGRLII